MAGHMAESRAELISLRWLHYDEIGGNGPDGKATGKQGKLGVAWLGTVMDVNANQACPAMGNSGACMRR